MRNKLVVFALLAFFALGLWGCAVSPGSGKSLGGAPAMLEPQAMLKFADLPVPQGFKLLPEESYSFESGGIRVGVLKYQGKASVDQVVNFYKEQMPMYNWNILNIVEYGERMINLDRENETCIIDLMPKGSSVIITMSLGPKAQASKKPDKPVK